MLVRGVAAAIVTLLACAPAAFGAFPGDNGRIAVTAEPTSGPSQVDVYSLNPDDTGLQQLTNDAAADSDVAWSPDGKRLAWVSDRDGNNEIYVMNANGSGVVRLTSDPGSDTAPAWSPDGTRIAFGSSRDGDPEVFVMDASGANQANLTQNSVSDGGPAWSPDGSRIAFARFSVGMNGTEIHVMNADGSGATRVTHDTTNCGGWFPCSSRGPDWSPDGTAITYIWSMFDGTEGDSYSEIRSLDVDSGETTTLVFGGDNPDGCCGDFLGHGLSPDGARMVWVGAFVGLQVADADGSDRSTLDALWPQYPGPRPSWQPVIHKEFPRPKGATPLRVALTVAFPECTSPNRMHGPPLAHPSCGGFESPPTGASPNLTVGAPDWNGASANFTGFARFDAVQGNRLTPEDEAEVKIRVQTSDIRCQRLNPIAACGADNNGFSGGDPSQGRDYNGELLGTVALHITDEHNSPFPGDGTGPGTVQGTVSLSFAIPCTETPSTGTIGSTCSLSTTADAVLPGMVPEQKRLNWEMGQVQVKDGGADGDADTAGDNQRFLTQGLLIP